MALCGPCAMMAYFLAYSGSNSSIVRCSIDIDDHVMQIGNTRRDGYRVILAWQRCNLFGYTFVVNID